MVGESDPGGRPEERYDATPFVPVGGAGLGAVRHAAEECRGCPLYRNTTGVVFGTGQVHASLMLVGEQPGDVEDKQGAPFVGPAGRVLRQCLDDAGVSIRHVYLTNAVKHFKYRREGKRRIHQKPTAAEIEACHPWLAAEMLLVDPEVIVALGATAARAVLGRPTPIEANHGVALFADDATVPIYVTYHPSAALRSREEREQIRDAITVTLRTAESSSARPAAMDVGPPGGGRPG